MADRETEAVFGALVREWQPRLFQFILRNIGQPDDAEDLAQQAFVEAFRAYESFRGESAVSTWLYGIAMNLVRNYLNRAPHRVHKIESDDVLEWHAGDDTVRPDRQVASRRSMAKLNTAMADLPADLRDVLVMVAVDGLACEEAAAMLSIPVGTVRSRVSRARSRLRESLGQGFIDEALTESH
jgi:RNA polymerase sigma factor (sigma-70 family)